jgi:hypothetical protein
VKLNLGSGLVGKPRSEGWVNIDRFFYPSTTEAEYQQVNLFEYPWPFITGSVSEAWCSHLIEHIPHDPKLVTDAYALGKRVCDNKWTRNLMAMDGFFSFFSEVWRVLEPNGVIDIVCPHGQSFYAFQDPSHCRYIVPTTFNYLVHNGALPGNHAAAGESCDYQIPCLFKLEGMQFVYVREAAALLKTGLEEMTQEALLLTSVHWNQAAEIHVQLRAIKEG